MALKYGPKTMIDSEKFANILKNRLKESSHPDDSRIYEILDGCDCELIEFKIGAMFESLRAPSEQRAGGEISLFRAVFKTKNYALYNPNVYDTRLLEVCKEIIPLTNIVVADISVEDISKEDEDEDIFFDKCINEDIRTVCAEDFASGDYASAAAKAADVFADEIFDKDISKDDCVEILRMFSQCLKKFE